MKTGGPRRGGLSLPRLIIKATLRVTSGACLTLVLISAGAQSSNAEDEAQARAVALARDGQYDAALTQLRRLYAEHPDDSALLHDLIAVLSWADRDADALALAASLTIDAVPTYAARAIAKAARNTQRFDLAAEWYRGVLLRDGQDSEARVGLLMSEADRGASESAIRVLDATPPAKRRELGLRLASAYVYERAGQPMTAMRVYDDLLAEQPAQRSALRGKALLLRSLLLPTQALQLADGHPGVLTEQEISRLKVDEIAVQLRLASKTPYPPPQQGSQLNSTLEAINAYLQESRDPSVTEALAYDRIVALADANQSARAVRAFEALETQSSELPPYLLAAAGKAYLQQQQPSAAVGVLEIAVAQAPDNLDLKFALIYAYLDKEQYQQAYELTRMLTGRLPLSNAESESSPVVKGNQRRLEAELVAGIAEAYGDQLAAAQARFEHLLAEAPHNADLRHELANIYRWRGWLDRSLDEYRQVLAADADFLSARTGYAHAQLDARQYREVEQTVAELRQLYPHEPSVATLDQQWQLHNKNELTVATTLGDSSGDTFGSEQYRFDATWYSRPQSYRLRALVNLHQSRATFADGGGNGERRRVGAGAEYRAERWIAAGVVSGDHRRGGELGLLGNVEWRVGDRWGLTGLIDFNSNDAQLRADRLGIETDVAAITGRYLPHEIMAVNFGWRQRSLSDGNAGTDVFGDVRRRVLNQPRWKLDLIAELAASRSRLQDVPYYSPSRDSSLWLGAIQEWRIHRRYQRSLVQVVDVRAGSYDQAGFKHGSMWRLEYSLQLRLSDALMFDAAVQRARMFYDGRPEYQTFLALGAQARF